MAELAQLKEEIARLIAETASAEGQATAAFSALHLQIENAAKREQNATSDCASRVAELTTTLVGRELSALPEASTSSPGKSGFVPLQGKQALADSYHKLQAEATRLRDEESERQARIAAMEAALKASEERIAGHNQRFEALLKNVKTLQEALQKKEAQERLTLQALEAERNDARRVIGEHSDRYASRLVSLWDQEGANAAASVASEFEPELLAIAREAEAELSESTTVVRSVARQLASYLSSLSSANELLYFSEQQSSNGNSNPQMPPAPPLGSAIGDNERYQQQIAAIARLESQRANHAKVAPRLLSIRSQCMAALDDLRQGKGGVSKAMMRLLSVTSTADLEAAQSGLSPADGDFRSLVAPFPLMTEALPNAGPFAGLLVQQQQQQQQQQPMPSRVRPPHDVYAKLEQQDAASLGMGPVEARLEVARLTEGVVTRLMALAEAVNDDDNAAAGKDDLSPRQAAEGSDAGAEHHSQLALHRQAEPHHAGAGPDAAAQQGLELVSDALRDSQQAVTAVSRPALAGSLGLSAPPSSSGGGGGGGGGNGSPSPSSLLTAPMTTPRRKAGALLNGTAGGSSGGSSNAMMKGDLGREYKLEAERLEAREKIQQAEEALVGLLKERDLAEAALAASRSKRGSSADVNQALEAAKYQLFRGSQDIEALRDWLSQAASAFRARFGPGHLHEKEQGSDTRHKHGGAEASDGHSGDSSATLRSLLGYGSTASTGRSLLSPGDEASSRGEAEPPLIPSPKVILSLKSQPTVVLPSPPAPPATAAPAVPVTRAAPAAAVPASVPATKSQPSSNRTSVTAAADGASSSSSASVKGELISSLLKQAGGKQQSASASASSLSASVPVSSGASAIPVPPPPPPRPQQPGSNDDSRDDGLGEASSEGKGSRAAAAANKSSKSTVIAAVARDSSSSKNDTSNTSTVGPQSAFGIGGSSSSSSSSSAVGLGGGPSHGDQDEASSQEDGQGTVLSRTGTKLGKGSGTGTGTGSGSGSGTDDLIATMMMGSASRSVAPGGGGTVLGVGGRSRSPSIAGGASAFMSPSSVVYGGNGSRVGASNSNASNNHSANASVIGLTLATTTTATTPSSPAGQSPASSASSLRRNTRIRAGSLVGPRGGRLYTPSTNAAVLLPGGGGENNTSDDQGAALGTSSSRRGSVVASMPSPATYSSGSGAAGRRASVSPRRMSVSPRAGGGAGAGARPSMMNGATLADLLRGAL